MSTSSRLYVVVGPNGSGKSSAINNIGLCRTCSQIINPDNYARRLTDIDDEYERYAMAMDECKGIRENLLESGVDFGFETVGSRDDKIEFIRRAKKKGYRVFVIFVTVSSPDICCERIRQRVISGGHDVPEEKVRSRYERTMAFMKTYIELADIAVVMDNSGSGAVEVIRKTNGVVSFTNEKESEWIKKYL